MNSGSGIHQILECNKLEQCYPLTVMIKYARTVCGLFISGKQDLCLYSLNVVHTWLKLCDYISAGHCHLLVTA